MPAKTFQHSWILCERPSSRFAKLVCKWRRADFASEFHACFSTIRFEAFWIESRPAKDLNWEVTSSCDCTLEIVSRNRESMQLKMLGEQRDQMVACHRRATMMLMEAETRMEECESEQKWFSGEIDRLTKEMKRKADEMEATTEATTPVHGTPATCIQSALAKPKEHAMHLTCIQSALASNPKQHDHTKWQHLTRIQKALVKLNRHDKTVW